MFKNHEDYLAQRNELLESAEALLKEGKTEEAEAKTKEVEDLDKAWEVFAEAQANINALKGAVKAPLSNEGVQKVIASTIPDEDDLEYRKAFMNYVMKGIPMTNADATTVASDVGPVIPNVILNRIVEKIETSGKILSLITRTFYKGGVTVPTSAAKPVATWKGERQTSEKQNKVLGSVTFSYHKLQVQVAVSLYVENVTLEVFERTISENIALAIVRALETAIIAGSGSGEPKGILEETVVAGQNIDIAEGSSITYGDLCNAEGLLPSGYDDAHWCMRKATFMSQIIGMTDSAGQPIARVNAGINGKPEYTILGRPVDFSDDVPAFAASVADDTIVAFMFRWEDYMLNTNMNVTVRKYIDETTDDTVTKATMLADGKVIDKNSLVTVTIKNS